MTLIPDIDPIADQAFIDLWIYAVSIYAKTTANVNGGAVASYAVSYPNLPALIVRATDKLKLIYAQRNIEITHKVYVQAAVSPNMGDLVQFVNGEVTRNFLITGPHTVLAAGTISVLVCREVVGNLIIDEEP